MKSLLHLLIILSVFIIQNSAQKGSDCESDSECYPQQSCQFGYCLCNDGYVKDLHYCFKFREHGEDCIIESQCYDFRMICEARGEENMKRCFCNKYHEWNEELKVCVPASNFTDIVRNLKEEVKWSEEIHLKGEKVFYGLVIAGLAVIGVGLVCTVVCLAYGCCFRGKRPTADEDTERLRINEVASVGSPEGTYVPIPTDLTGQPHVSTSSSPTATFIMPIG